MATDQNGISAGEVTDNDHVLSEDATHITAAKMATILNELSISTNEGVSTDSDQDIGDAQSPADIPRVNVDHSERVSIGNMTFMNGVNSSNRNAASSAPTTVPVVSLPRGLGESSSISGSTFDTFVLVAHSSGSFEVQGETNLSTANEQSSTSAATLGATRDGSVSHADTCSTSPCIETESASTGQAIPPSGFPSGDISLAATIPPESAEVNCVSDDTSAVRFTDSDTSNADVSAARLTDSETSNADTNAARYSDSDNSNIEVHISSCKYRLHFINQNAVFVILVPVCRYFLYFLKEHFFI